MERMKAKLRGVARTALLFLEKGIMLVVRLLMQVQNRMERFRLRFYLDVDRQAIAWAEEARKQKKGMFHVNGWFIISGGNQRSAMRQYKRLYDAGKLKRWPNENDN